MARDQPTIWQISAGRENYPNRLIDVEQIIPHFIAQAAYYKALFGIGLILDLEQTSDMHQG